MPEGPIQTVPYRIAAFPVVTDVEHDLAVPSVLNEFEEVRQFRGHGRDIGPAAAVARQFKVHRWRQRVGARWGHREEVAGLLSARRVGEGKMGGAPTHG